MATDYKQKKSVVSLSQVTPTSQMGAKPNEKKQEAEQTSKKNWLLVACIAIGICSISVQIVLSVGVVMVGLQNDRIEAKYLMLEQQLGRLLNETDVPTDPWIEWQRNITAEVSKLTKGLKDKYRELQEFQTVTRNNVSRLANQIFDNHQLARESITMVTERLAQHEQQTNASLEDLAFQFESSMNIIDQTIYSLIKTTTGNSWDIEVLFTHTKQMSAQLNTVNASLQLLNTDLIQLRDETSNNVSEIISLLHRHAFQQATLSRQLTEVQYSLSQLESQQDTLKAQFTSAQSSIDELQSQQASLSGQLADTHQRMDSQDGEIADLHSSQETLRSTLNSFDARIRALRNSGTNISPSTLLLPITTVMFYTVYVFII